MRHRRPLSSFALVMMWLAVCGCDGRADGIAFESFAMKSLDAICGYDVRCSGFPDLGTCRAAQRDEFGRLRVAINAGRVAYHPDEARACLTALENLTCTRSTVGTALRRCDAVVTGQVAAGGTCFDATECVGRGRCDRDENCDSEAQCCAGTCQPAVVVRAAGESCNPTTMPCEVGLRCSYEPPGSELGTCREPPTAGQICDVFSCGDDLFCDGGVSPPVCRGFVGSGQSCSDTYQCAEVDDACFADTQKCTKRRKPGQPCAVESECVRWATCADGQCVALAVVGAACDEDISCLSALSCESGTCVLPPERPACP